MKLVTAEQMRAVEAAAARAGVTTAELMEHAGAAAAREVWRALDQRQDRAILVLVGPGNNGGDGLVAARYLHTLGADVYVYLLRARDETDPTFSAAVEAGTRHTSAEDDPAGERLETLLRVADCVVDAVLGTGSSRPLAGLYGRALDRLARARRGEDRDEPLPLLIALDLPTGVDPDTGAADPLTVAADRTICFGFTKVGLTQHPARTLAGELVTVDIGIPAGLSALPYDELNYAVARAGVVPRPHDANKGTFGHAVVAGGSRQYPGAVRLAAEACARSGAGLTTIAAPAVVQPLIAPTFPDATHIPLPSAAGAMRGSEAARALLRSLAGVGALLLGPGLGLTSATEAFVRDTLTALDQLEAAEEVRALVLDADALNVLARHPNWHKWTSKPRVLTPHPGEMARLLGTTVAEVQSHRLAVALRYAEDTRSVVVLKGAGTIIAAPDGRAVISQVANPMLATAGTGDVLAGLIVGLIAQGAEAFEAASTAVYLHATAAAEVTHTHGPAAGLASDLLHALPAARRTLDE